MWITVQSKRVPLNPRMRRAIENYIGKVFSRQRRQIASCTVTIEPLRAGDDEALKCQIRLWSAQLGSIGVLDVGDTIRTAVQQTSLRAREVARRRLHKRVARARRAVAGRLNRRLPVFSSAFNTDEN